MVGELFKIWHLEMDSQRMKSNKERGKDVDSFAFNLNKSERILESDRVW